MTGRTFATIDELQSALLDASYLADRGLSTVLFLALKLEKPLLLEGEAGVGKTEAAKAMARVLPARLIRLQCYEGLDLAHAVYEWNYSRQLLHIRAAQEGTVSEEELFGPEFLIRRPLLEAIESEEPVVLLIDEVDRADDEFEAFLLEVLSDFQITIPEIGTIAATRKPVVVLTSNRTRELHDALKRRTLFHWIDHPSLEREVEIVRLADRESDRARFRLDPNAAQRDLVLSGAQATDVVVAGRVRRRAIPCAIRICRRRIPRRDNQSPATLPTHSKPCHAANMSCHC